MSDLWGSDSEEEAGAGAPAPLPAAAAAAEPAPAGPAAAGAPPAPEGAGGGDGPGPPEPPGDGAGAGGAGGAPAELPEEPPEPAPEPAVPAERLNVAPGAPKLGGRLVQAKLGNLVGVELEPFDPAAVDPGKEAARDRQSVIRWRQGPGGKETNAHLVKWSDGSVTVHVGEDTLRVTYTPIENNFLYVARPGNVFEAEGAIGEKATFQPLGINTSAHAKLRDSAQLKSRGTRKVKTTTTVFNPEMMSKKREREEEERIRASESLQKKQAREYSKYGYAAPQVAPKELNAKFLEDMEDDYDEGPTWEGADAARDDLRRRAYDPEAERAAEQRIMQAKSAADLPAAELKEPAENNTRHRTRALLESDDEDSD